MLIAKRNLLILFFIILLDQLTKGLVLKYHFQSLSFNQGISFGWLPGSEWLGVNAVLLFFLILLAFCHQSWSFWLIFAGGLSNFFDRIIRGSVVDWIKLPVFPWSFNVADISLTLGVILLIYRLQGQALRKRPCGKINDKPQNHF